MVQVCCHPPGRLCAPSLLAPLRAPAVALGHVGFGQPGWGDMQHAPPQPGGAGAPLVRPGESVPRMCSLRDGSYAAAIVTAPAWVRAAAVRLH